jgi:hypothetical protein
MPLLISTVSITSRQTRQNINRREDFKEFKMYRKGKDIKKRHPAAFVSGPSVLGEKFPTDEF